ncbi:hypothetical protein KIPB_002066, partial [Kipferlia bialata]|eukprot:g2066.t1
MSHPVYVSCAYVHDRMEKDRERTVVIDASGDRTQYLGCRIPGSLFFDYASIYMGDTCTSAPPLPDAETMHLAVCGMGVGRDTHVYVYDIK